MRTLTLTEKQYATMGSLVCLGARLEFDNLIYLANGSDTDELRALIKMFEDPPEQEILESWANEIRARNEGQIIDLES